VESSRFRALKQPFSIRRSLRKLGARRGTKPTVWILIENPRGKCSANYNRWLGWNAGRSPIVLMVMIIEADRPVGLRPGAGLHGPCASRVAIATKQPYAILGQERRA